MVFVFGNGFFNCIFVFISFIAFVAFFVAFWKKKFISSETRLSSEMTLSSLPTSVTLLVIFRFSENNGWIFFQKVLLSTIFDGSRLSKYVLRSFLHNLLQEFVFFCTFSLTLEFLFWNRGFLNMSFSSLPS